MSEEVREFRIEIEESALIDLKQRLGNTRWPEAETPDDWSQGIPLDYVKELCRYWEHEYDWRERESRLNQYAQFTTDINDLSIHFIHVKSRQSGARPLLMTHGWPGSIVEFQKVIGPLTDPVAHGGDAEDAFHLVCPSLPGYGFSGKPTVTGWGVEKIAQSWNQLMIRLGYESYFAQGGDWGAAVTRAIASQNLGACQGVHLNMPIVAPDRDTMDDLTAEEEEALAGLKHYRDWDSGYSKQQSTRPQTLGYGLVDSPVGQAAWIMEKFWAWTDNQGHPEDVLGRDELLDNIMMYWLNACGASSARLYWESFGKRSNTPVELPVGLSIFPREIFKCSERWARKSYLNLIQFNVLEKGGHFAAFEQPELFVQQVRECFRLLR